VLPGTRTLVLALFGTTAAIGGLLLAIRVVQGARRGSRLGRAAQRRPEPDAEELRYRSEGRSGSPSTRGAIGGAGMPPQLRTTDRDERAIGAAADRSARESAVVGGIAAHDAPVHGDEQRTEQ
jgi:hypothetical protein